MSNTPSFVFPDAEQQRTGTSTPTPPLPQKAPAQGRGDANMGRLQGAS